MVSLEEQSFFRQHKLDAKLKLDSKKQALCNLLPPSLRACLKCHEHHLSTFAPQRRASDEPASITYICEKKECGFTWTESG